MNKNPTFEHEWDYMGVSLVKGEGELGYCDLCGQWRMTGYNGDKLFKLSHDDYEIWHKTRRIDASHAFGELAAAGKQEQFETTIEDLAPALELTNSQKSGVTLYRSTRKDGKSVIETLRPTYGLTITPNTTIKAGYQKASKTEIQTEVARRQVNATNYRHAKEGASKEHGAIAEKLFDDSLTFDPTFPIKPEHIDDDEYDAAMEVYEADKKAHFIKLEIHFDGTKDLTLSVADVNRWSGYLHGYSIKRFVEMGVMQSLAPFDNGHHNERAGYVSMITLDGDYPTGTIELRVDEQLFLSLHNRDYVLVYSESFRQRTMNTWEIEIRETGKRLRSYDMTLEWSSEEIEDGRSENRLYDHNPISSINMMGSLTGTLAKVETRIRLLSIAIEIGKRWETQASFESSEYL